MRRLSPCFGALAFYRGKLLERALEFFDAICRVGTLHERESRGAFAHRCITHSHQRSSGERHHADVEAGVERAELLDCLEQAQVQVTPLAHRFPLVVSLLPSLQPVLRRLVLLFSTSAHLPIDTGNA